MGGAGAFVDNCTDDNEQDQIEGCEEDSIQNENEESSLPDCGDLDFCESLDQENGEKLEDEDFHEDYSCEVCEGSFMHLTDLFKHFENHDTGSDLRKLSILYIALIYSFELQMSTLICRINPYPRPPYSEALRKEKK